MSRITEALRKAAREREERLRQRRESEVTPPPAETPPQSLSEQALPSPPVKEEKTASTSLQEALHRRAEKTFRPSQPETFPTPTRPPTAAPTPPLPPVADLEPYLITHFKPHSPTSEQYRLIRTNLQSLTTPNPLRTIVISSSTYGEGKTVTAINLAIIMAQDINKPILLIDCDLRKPQVCQYLRLTPQTDLVDLLTTNIPLESTLLPTKISNLTVLPGSKVIPNPSSLLESAKMKHLLTEVKSRFEYTIIDTSPVLPVTDAGIISPQTDGVLLVIQADRTKREVVQRAQSVLTEAQTEIIGFVLTGVQHPIPDFIYRHL